MTFNKFIDKLNPEAVNEWWEKIPSEAPTDAEDSNWKYKLSKKGKCLPFKWSMRHLAETINLDLNSFSSNLENRTKFCEAFNFEIKEELVFDNTEKAKLKNFYYKDVSKSVIFQNWIDYAHSLVNEIGIDPYKIRMAIRNSPQEAMVIIGMPNILTYKEVEDKSIVGFILPDEKADEFTSKMKIYKKFPFENGNSLYRYEIQSWDEIPEAIKSHNSKLVAELYQSIKDTKRANWNQEASTTNSALKYLIFKGETIDTFFGNVKEEFIKWFFKNTERKDGSLSKSQLKTDLEQSQKYFERNIFEVDESNFKQIISFLKTELYNNPEFLEYSKNTGTHRPRAILGKENYLKFLEKKFSETNYWIFQCNPAIYDLDNALKNDAVHSWKVAAHKDKIKPGDKAIIWVTGSDARCLALGEITSEPETIPESLSEKKYYLIDDPDDGGLRVGIKISHNFIDAPLYWNEIKELKEFSDFKVGNQGTNFKATKEEFESILEMRQESNSKVYWEVKKIFPENTVEKFLNILRKFLDKHQISAKDERLSFNVRPLRKRLVFLIGNRYALSIEKRNNKVFHSVIHPEILSENYGKFTNHRGETEVYWNDLNTLEGMENKIEEGFLVELKRNHKSPYRKSSNPAFMADVMSDSAKFKLTTMEVNSSLNTILYGPPGTGKTFKLQKKYFDKFTVSENSLTKEQYLDNVAMDLTWWQTFAIALKDLGTVTTSVLLDHPLVRAKQRLSLAQNIKPIAWSRLQAHTVEECPNVKVTKRSDPQIFFKEEDSKWRVHDTTINELYPEANDLIDQIKNYQPNSNKAIKNYEFVTFHQSFSYEDFIEGIKPRLGEEENEISYEIQDGIFKKLCLKADADRENNYAIFIDEINRGNVSAIFGELITLIEQDKRLGKENELKARLPYSKKELGVPPNLYIFGTMNTADRSVEALDTALRRRFSFEEVMPIPELLENIEFHKFNLSQVLMVINNRIEALLDRDHTIGHSYFINIQSGDIEGLKHAFENKVIPLLQEYFYHDYEKIAWILGEGFVERKEASVKFARLKKMDPPEMTSSFELKEIEDIEEAIRTLLNEEDEESE